MARRGEPGGRAPKAPKADASAPTAAGKAEAARQADRAADRLDVEEEGDASDLPLLEMASFADNDEWAFRQADRQIEQLPQRVGGRDKGTESGVFDQSTMMILHKLLIHGVIKSVDLPIATGKEANVFRATTPGGGFLAVKIYRVNTATFKSVLQYIQGDERFEGVSGDRRTLVKAWCQKEFRNLSRMRDVGCSVPEPVKAVGNVLLMEYLGKAEGPWPQIREVELADPQSCYESVVHDYVLAHNGAGLVHADISEYNILLEGADIPAAQRPRMIDVGQAVLHQHPMAREFLTRDVKNIVRFFKRRGVEAKDEDILGALRKPDKDQWGEASAERKAEKKARRKSHRDDMEDEEE